MKKHFIIILCFICSYSYGQNTKTKDTINADGTLNLYAFGAVMDGVFDDSPAAERAVAYAKTYTAKSREIIIPVNKILRLTRPLIIGRDFIPLELCFKNIDSVNCYRCDYPAYLDGIRSVNMQIKGKGESSIYIDFNDTSKLNAGLLLGAMQGRSQSGKEQFSLEISNVGIYAQGYFKNGVRVLEKVDYSKNNCVGIAALFTEGLKVKDVTIIGFKEGQLFNNTYYFECTNINSRYCKRVSFDIRCHRGSYNNIRNYYCEKGNEIRSNQIQINGLYSNSCKTGLHIAGGNNEINSVYLETTVPGNGQLIIGDNPGDEIVSNQSLYGIVFTNLTLSAPYKIGINFKDNVRAVTINGAVMQSTTFVFKNPLTKVKVENVQGTLSGYNWVKPQYVDLYGKSINF